MSVIFLSSWRSSGILSHPTRRAQRCADAKMLLWRGENRCERSAAAMRAEVLIPRSSWRLTDRASLYSYTVPAHLADQLQPGQLAAVPFGERETAGVIWSLDASDDTGDLSEGDEAGDSDEDNVYSAARHLVAAAGRTGALASSARAGGMDVGVLRRAACHDSEAHAAAGTRSRHSLYTSPNRR